MTKAVIFDSWGVLQNERGPNAGLIEVVKELRGKGLQLFVLSNATASEAAQNEPSTATFRDLFDKFYYAYETGFKKPDPRAFALILEENNLKPQECVYFDDAQINVDAAQMLGIKGYVYKSAEQVKNLALE